MKILRIIRPKQIRFISNIRKSSCLLCSSRSYSNFRRHEPFQPPEEVGLGRSWRILKDEWGRIRNGTFSLRFDENIIFPNHCDVAIIGGGIVGSTIAYYLKQFAGHGLHVVVFEKDQTYASSSTMMSLGSIHHNFSLKENIEMSLHGAEFIRNIRKHLGIYGSELPDIHYQPTDYLYLATSDKESILQESVKLQTTLGVKADLLTPSQLKAEYPWMDVTGVDLAYKGLGTEGWYDPALFLGAIKKKAISMGTRYVTGEVVGFERQLDFPGSSAVLDTIENIVVNQKDNIQNRTKAAYYVIASGPDSREVCELLGMGSDPDPEVHRSEFADILTIPLPVRRKKKSVFVFSCPIAPGLEFPHIVDTSGSYVRRDGFIDNFVCGNDQIGEEGTKEDDENLDVDFGHFTNNVLPSLIRRVPDFKDAKIETGWAGYSDHNFFDQSPVIGMHPYAQNVVFATGLSGYGIQHAPAVGRAIKELLIDKDFTTIDLTRFGFGRFAKIEPIRGKLLEAMG